MTGNGEYVNLLRNLLEKIREITSIELKFGGFYPFETTVQQTANSLKTAELSTKPKSAKT